MATPIDLQRWGRRKRVLEEALVEGFSPFRESGGKGSSVEEACRRLAKQGDAIDSSTLGQWIRVQERRSKKGQDHALPDWTLYRRPATVSRTAEGRAARRWLCTAAQNDTPAHGPFFANLRAFASYLGAEIIVAPFTYQHSLFTDHETRNGFFAAEVRPFLRFDAADLGAVTFHCEMNTLPTAARPLSGLHSYTRGRTGIFPHAKLALESIPTMPGTPAPIIMTTGACTIPNYVAKKAGLKASFHHVIGATIVEEDTAGRVWCRQINAASDGSFQDLDLVVRDGSVLAGQRVEGITWGDIHRRKLDRSVALASWGYDPETDATTDAGSMLDVLRPRFQFFHDLLDFESRNHHENEDNLARFDLYVRGKESLEDEFAEAARFVRQTERDWCRSVIVESNHDKWTDGWLSKADYRKDPVNAEWFLRLQLAAYQARRQQEDGFSIFRHGLKLCDPRRLDGIEFSPEQGSYVICHEAGGIECGSHGHLGANGSRGTAQSLLKCAMKMNRGHEHACSIYDGIYTAGVSARLNHGYNKGPSSWGHSHVVTYCNGKRAIVSVQDGKWRA